MNQNLKPLCLAFWTPPTVRPQAILIGKMIPEWIAQGTTPVIVTYEGQGHWDINAPVYTIPQLKINKWLNLVLPIRIYLRYKHQQQIIRTITQIAKQHGCNIIFSFANPQESNVIGAAVKIKTGIPFVSHFSDPWYDNPCTPMSWWRAYRVLQQETYIIKQSDAIIFINDHLKDMVMKKYPERLRTKGAVIHHAFSPKDYPLSATEVSTERAKDIFMLSHVGVFYKERNPKTLFRALQVILTNNADLRKKIRLQLVGCDGGYSDFSGDDVKEMARAYQLEDIVTFVPRVNFRESLRYMQLADCLVLIDIRSNEGYALPSKLIDYAGSGTRIVGISSSGSPVAQFIENLGEKNFEFDEIDKLAAHINDLIEGRVITKRNEGFLKNFNIAETTKKLFTLFSSLIK